MLSEVGMHGVQCMRVMHCVAPGHLRGRKSVNISNSQRGGRMISEHALYRLQSTRPSMHSIWSKPFVNRIAE